MNYYSFLNKRMFFILLFLFSGLRAQKLTITNNSGNPIIIKNGKKEVTLNNRDKKEFTETNNVSINTLNEFIQNITLFLEPTEKLNITIEKNNKFVYTGDQAERHEYITQQLNIDTFGKINTYEQIGQRRNSGELKNASELLLLDILRKTELPNIIISPKETISIRRLKNYIKYNWLYTLFTTINHQDKHFKKEALNYYYKKYIETDIPKFSCATSLQYRVIEVLAKNKSLLPAELPTYPIVERTDDDTINQYLPQNCQKQYFQEKYNYLNHIEGHNKEYYNRILKEKFNE